MRPERRTPADFSADWPHEPCSDPDADALRLLALRLREVAGPRSLRQLSVVTGVNHAAIGKVIAGETWPDTRTLARLERGLEARLWPEMGPAGAHVAAPPHVVVGERTEKGGRSDDDSTSPTPTS